jgi:hypothetical protein
MRDQEDWEKEKYGLGERKFHWKRLCVLILLTAVLSVFAVVFVPDKGTKAVSQKLFVLEVIQNTDNTIRCDFSGAGLMELPEDIKNKQNTICDAIRQSISGGN